VKDISPLTLHSVAAALSWPDDHELLTPTGSGPATFADLARRKVGRAVAPLAPGKQCRVGILATDPANDETQAPMAIVVEFGGKASDPCLHELHRLAWNFSHSPALITVEPDLVRVWSCCEAPAPEASIEQRLVHSVSAAALQQTSGGALQSSAARALHWLNLISGHFLASHHGRFERDGRADQLLLQNLSAMRDQLREAGLRDDDISHDLLARVIFVQFLFDRRDADGAAALDAEKLAELHRLKVLSREYDSLPAILSDYEDTYRLFDWLNGRFNGDLFPGRGDTPQQRAKGWSAERARVKPEHLAMLGRFLRGDIILESGQSCLWPMYAFDVIPLEFISSIYETFVAEASTNGVFYTPPYLVDFVLDQVLPWHGEEWDLKILDPACGSGIFLVKAFQRLVHRWKTSHPDRIVPADLLHRLLVENLLGVDKDKHAIRVACFSLYLAMCDEIEPRRYWTDINFPPMRGKRLICSDFFEDGAGFSTPGDDAAHPEVRYDLLIGNAPWGRGLLTERAKQWSEHEDHCWEVANKDIGCLFLAKGTMLLKPTGRLALIQSAASLLFNSANPARGFRKKLFATYRVEAVYNLAALRFQVFARKDHAKKVSVSPSCVVVMRPDLPADEELIAYVSPKAAPRQVEEAAIAIEPGDYRWIRASDAATEPLVWTALMWGTPRDLELLRKLRERPTLARQIAKGQAHSREGIIPGNREKRFPNLVGRRIFTENRFPPGSPVYLDAQLLPVVEYPLEAHSKDSTNFAAFATPQLLIKQGYQIKVGRLQARLVLPAGPDGVLCSQSYVTVTSEPATLAAACLSYNSKLAIYFLQLTSGRMAAYRPETTVAELLDVPLPDEAGDLEAITDYAGFDRQMIKAFKLKDAEQVLIDDMIDIHVVDFRSTFERPGLRPTGQISDDLLEELQSEPVLGPYARYFTRVLKAGFGADKGVRARIFSQPAHERLPFRMVSFELTETDSGKPELLKTHAPDLLVQMQHLASQSRRARLAGARSSLVARFYDGSAAAPTIILLKPDATRYWTRSAALNDADEVCADLFALRPPEQPEPHNQ
jgi:hypothetical protein